MPPMFPKSFYSFAVSAESVLDGMLIELPPLDSRNMCPCASNKERDMGRISPWKLSPSFDSDIWGGMVTAPKTKGGKMDTISPLFDTENGGATKNFWEDIFNHRVTIEKFSCGQKRQKITLPRPGDRTCKGILTTQNAMTSLGGTFLLKNDWPQNLLGRIGQHCALFSTPRFHL